ncbi:carbohydrate ABC transporter permease [Lederbergia galactosidilytica]|uniref:ABC transporter n=1 Tax=Lederbergia galactosidilytica TaxID=217031 RepID=A0A0Q9XNI4_9BACI|nr:sugar ABC transporter permease [Lederbergia galactosidilytica]KRG09835.1 ABC transporter [Lederbergia galactosidilytica]KRG15311.1 ABC transporter [Virgibacillus soli]MBP1915993.1 multiple sugar transport system permease protein [Lederbergia galactosidilytica]OAK71278.1 ABC transporter [Lederbergia galactosidilytica]
MFSKVLRKDHYGYVFIAPFFIIFLIFGLYPIVYSFYLSFTDWDGFGTPVLVGLGNYQRLAGDFFFYKSLFNTLLIWGVSVIPQLTVSLVLAVILHEKFVKGKSIFRAVFFFPNIVTAASLGLLVGLIFSWQTGSFNQFLMSLGFIQDPIHWADKPIFMRILVSSILFWQYFGYSMIIYIAGLQGISKDLLEAAEIDGASKVKVFFHITLPLLRPIIIFQVITSIIGGMQIFDQPYTLTDGTGEPDKATLTSVMYLYETAFTRYQYGYGSAIAFGLFIVIVIFSILSFAITKRRTNTENIQGGHK